MSLEVGDELTMFEGMGSNRPTRIGKVVRVTKTQAVVEYLAGPDRLSTFRVMRDSWAVIGVGPYGPYVRRTTDEHRYAIMRRRLINRLQRFEWSKAEIPVNVLTQVRDLIRPYEGSKG